MINEQENRVSLTKQSDLEYDKNSVEMMRYRTNGLSYKLGVGGMAFSVLGAFICLNSANPVNALTLVIILMNIVILLGGFLAAEKVKNYIQGGAIAQIIFGAVCIGRIFWIPVQLIINYNIYIGYVSGKTTFDTDEYQYYTQVPAFKTAEKFLGESIKAKHKNSKYAFAFLTPDGNIRAIIAMILLAAAGGLFIAAGVIGFKRARKLHRYLASINVKK